MNPLFIARLLALTTLLLCNSAWGKLDLKNPSEGGIYDPGQFLDKDFAIGIEQRISYEREHRQFEIFVLLFEDEPSQGADILAKQAGESWSIGEYWAVIYQVGRDSEPDCLVGGALIAQLPSSLVESNLRGARNTALLVTTPQNRLKSLVTNLTDAFGFLRIQANESYEAAVKARDKRQAVQKFRKEKLRAIIAVSSVALIGLGIMAFGLWRKLSRKVMIMEFPRTSPRRRLSGPATGGGDVLVKYGRKT